MQSLWRFLVMGAGNIGLRHIRLIAGLPGAQLVAVVEPDQEQVKAVAEIWPGPCFGSFADFAASGLQAEVMAVCTPNYLHSEHALQAVSAGLHVVCEKPLALELEEGKAILEGALQAGRQLFCMHQLVLGPVMQWVKSLLLQKQAGAIRQIQVIARWNRDEAYYLPGSWRGKLQKEGGPLFTQFSHFIHALYWLFGDFDITRACFEKQRQPVLTEFEDGGQVNLRFENGAAGQLHYTTAAEKSDIRSEIWVVTEKGQFRIHGQYLQHLSDCQLPGVAVPDLRPLLPLGLQERFYREVLVQLNQPKPEHTSAREALKVVALIQQIYAFRPLTFTADPAVCGISR